MKIILRWEDSIILTLLNEKITIINYSWHKCSFHYPGVNWLSSRTIVHRICFKISVCCQKLVQMSLSSFRTWVERTYRSEISRQFSVRGTMGTNLLLNSIWLISGKTTFLCCLSSARLFPKWESKISMSELTLFSFKLTSLVLIWTTSASRMRMDNWRSMPSSQSNSSIAIISMPWVFSPVYSLISIKEISVLYRSPCIWLLLIASMSYLRTFFMFMDCTWLLPSLPLSSLKAPSSRPGLYVGWLDKWRRSWVLRGIWWV